jgi:hypothetical protein
MGALSFAFVALTYAISLMGYVGHNRDGVTLQDAFEFRRLLPFGDVREMWMISQRHIYHHDEYIIVNYGFAAYQRWRCEAQKCRDAWDILDNICHPSIGKSPEYTMSQLRALRGVIGADAYDARMMPPPCPGWMFRP